MTNSFTDDINDNFWSVKSEIESIKTNYTPLQVTNAINSAIANIPSKTSDLTNDSGFITGVNSSDITSALGYTPYSSTNPNGYITGINSSDVATALGYAPANVTLSNLGATSSTNIDGQFVQKYLQLDNHTSKGSWGYNLGQTDVVVDGTTYSARNYLPDNNYIYVVYGQLEVVSTNDTHYYVGTGKEPYSDDSNMFFAYGRTHSNGNRQENFFCFPIVPNASGYQFIYDQIAVNTASTGARTSLIGYRRVGTNS